LPRYRPGRRSERKREHIPQLPWGKGEGVIRPFGGMGVMDIPPAGSDGHSLVEPDEGYQTYPQKPFQLLEFGYHARS